MKRAIYSFDGSRRAFYEWLQREPPEGWPVTLSARTAPRRCSALVLAGVDASDAGLQAASANP